MAVEQANSIPAQASTDWDVDSLLTAFIRAVSHDLRSPLLTLSLSNGLLADAKPGGGEQERVALDGMRHGIAELERMLDAISLVSRARSRLLNPHEVTLRELLTGHMVLSETDLIAHVAISLDTRGVDEALAAVAGDMPANVRVEGQATTIVLSAVLPPGIAAVEQPPVHALLASLQDYAGTAVVPLAAAQVQIERQGGTLTLADGRLRIELPLVLANVSR